LFRIRHAQGLGWALAAVLATLPAQAQMSMGSQDTMEGMEGMNSGEESAPAPKHPAPKATPAKPAVPKTTVSPAKPMEMTPAPESHTPAKPPQPAMEGMGMATPSEDGHATESGHEEDGMKEMSEPPPSSMDGGRILIVFALLNAAILAVAAVLKFRRTPATSSREVKA